MTPNEAGYLGYLKAKDKLEEFAAEKLAALKALHSTKNPKCAHCAKPISFEKRCNRFCNHSCAAKHSNPKRKQRANCLECSKKVGNTKASYCSSRCWGLHKRKIVYAEIIKTGCAYPHLKSQTTVKRFLRWHREESCEVCQITEWQDKPAPLVMDHIDGNSDNWKLDNLRLVCGNCDMQLPTYKSKNKGKGRHSKRQRYAKGKSY